MSHPQCFTTSVPQSTASPPDYYCPISTPPNTSPRSSMFPTWKLSRLSTTTGIKSIPLTPLPSKKCPLSTHLPTSYSPATLQPHWPSLQTLDTSSFCSLSASHLLFDWHGCLPSSRGYPKCHILREAFPDHLSQCSSSPLPKLSHCLAWCPVLLFLYSSYHFMTW